MSSKEQGDRRFTKESLRNLMDEVAHLQVATTFHITDGVSERIFYFVRGGARLLSSGPHSGPGLSGHLLETGRIEVDALHSSLEESRNRKKDLRQVLIDNGVISKTECNEIIARLVRDELMELVFWKDAAFVVHTDEPPEEIFKLDLPALHGGIDNEKLTRDILTWLDEWSKIEPLLPSDQVKIRTTDAGRQKTGQQDTGVQRLLAICEDEIPLRQAWLSAGMPLDELCLKLVDLEREQMVTLRPDDAPGRSPEQEIQDLEDSLRHLIAKDLVRERLATLYEKIKRPSKAVEQLETIAESALAAKDAVKAAERYKVILRLQPQNVGAFERLLDFSRGTPAAGDVKGFALSHLQRLLHRSLTPEAEQCATILQSFPSAREDVQEFKASLLAARGQSQEAAEELVRLARVHSDGGDLGRATECLRKALKYDESNVDAQSELDRLREKIEARDVKKTVVAAARVALGREAPEAIAHEPSGTGSRIALAVVIVAVVGAGLLFLLGRGWSHGSGDDTSTATAYGYDGGEDNDPGDEDPPHRDDSDERTDPRAAPDSSPTHTATRHDGRASGGSNAAETPSPAASRRAPPWPPRERPRPKDPCDPSNFRTRPLSNTQVAYFADSCSLFVRDEKGKVLHELPGGEGARWAVSHGGRFVCRWAPGEHPTVFTMPQGLEFPLSWRIPEFAGALAIGRDRIVVRERNYTAMFRFDGTPVTSASLPAWEEGVLVEDRLVLVRQTETRAMWIVQADNLDYVWSCSNDPEGLIVR